MGFLCRDEINELGFGYVGENVFLSEKASYYNCKNIVIRNNVRIDDFCVLSAGSGGIVIGNYVHIAVYTSLIGAGKITLNDFSGISSRVAIYSSNDDYSGIWMTNPMVPEAYTHVIHADVIVGRHAIIGTGSVILPGVTLEEGVVIGALTLVTKNCESYGVYSGVPAKKIKSRKRNVLEHERRLLQNGDSGA